MGGGFHQKNLISNDFINYNFDNFFLYFLIVCVLGTLDGGKKINFVFFLHVCFLTIECLDLRPVYAKLRISISFGILKLANGQTSNGSESFH